MCLTRLAGDLTERREAPTGVSRRVRVDVPWATTQEERIRPPAPGRVRLRLVVAYDGTPFRGVAPQPGLRTIGGEVLSALTKVLRHPTDAEPLPLVLSGRTDAGVHAWCQVMHVDVVPPPGGRGRAPRDPSLLVEGIDLERVIRSLNGLLGPSIVVRGADVAPGSFDARFSASWRRYRYTVLNTVAGDPFLAGVAWHVAEPLDLSLMRLASDAFVGAHDFAAFCRAADPTVRGATTARVVTETRWVDTGSGALQFEIAALAFCQQMVRSIVGFLVDVGRGRQSPGSVLETLAARRRLPALAPAHGLCLWEVGYPAEFALPVPPAGSAGSGWRPRP